MTSQVSQYNSKGQIQTAEKVLVPHKFHKTAAKAFTHLNIREGANAVTNFLIPARNKHIHTPFTGTQHSPAWCLEAANAAQIGVRPPRQHL